MTPIAKSEMLIRRPPAQVFAAFTDPAVTTRFWFTKSSGPLEVGRRVRWEWEMYNFGVDVEVKVVEPPRRLVVEWGAFDAPTTIEWTFTPHGEVGLHGADATFVSITNRGFTGSDDEIVAQAIGSTEGFSFVLAGAKAWLEHGLGLGLIADRFPAP